jgi:hypothetical protein
MPMPKEEKPKRSCGRPATPAQVMDANCRIASLIQEWNENHCVLRLGGKTVVATESVDPVFGRTDLVFSAFQDFKAYHCNEFTMVPNGNDGLTSKSAATVWLESRDRRTYQGLVFSPNKDVPGFLNLWRGFAVEPKPGRWDLMRAHILNVICGGDTVHFQYLLAWLADAVQNPGAGRPGVAVVLRGKKGTGKGVFVSAVGKIFGSHFLHLTQSGHLTGKFNSHLKSALLVFADEAFWAGDRSAEGTLKGLITEETIQVEPKGKDSFSVRNNIRLIVASNEDWVVPASLDERRYFVLDVKDDHMQDTEYFGELVKESRGGGIAAMLHDLMSWPLGGINLREPPRTEALVGQILQSIPSIQKWYYGRLLDGKQLREGMSWERIISTQNLHKDYLDFCGQICEKYPEPDFLFSKRLREFEKSIKSVRPRQGFNREYSLRFPDLAECRTNFVNKIGFNVDWEDESSE